MPIYKKILLAVAIVIVLAAGIISVSFYRGSLITAERNKLLASYRELDQKHMQSLEGKPWVVYALMGIEHGGAVHVPAERPSLRALLQKHGRVPAIISLPGCGFATWGKDVPDDVPQFIGSEDPKILGRPDMARACLNGDYKLVEKILNEELAFILQEVSHYDWVDQNRLLLMGSGEAGPIVARYSGRVMHRVIWADPCSIPWGAIDTSTPLTVLISKQPQGLQTEPAPHVDVTAENLGIKRPMGELCEGLPRPAFPTSVNVRMADAPIYSLSRPAELLDVQKTIFSSLMRK